MSTDPRARLGENPSDEVWIAGLEKSEGGTDDTMFQFQTMSAWAGDRAPATGADGLIPFVWLDINGRREDGTDDTMTLRLDWESAERVRDALAEVLRLRAA